MSQYGACLPDRHVPGPIGGVVAGAAPGDEAGGKVKRQASDQADPPLIDFETWNPLDDSKYCLPIQLKLID